MLCGCTEGDAADLLPLAKSWLRAPKLTNDGEEVPYDVTQRAYILSSPARGSLTFRTEASAGRPLNGLCLIIKGLSETGTVAVDGKPCPDARSGIVNAWDGPSSIVWIPVKTDKPVTITL